MTLTVLRMFLVSIGTGLAAAIATRLILPGSTKIEEGLLIIEIAFAVSAVITIVVQIFLRRRKKDAPAHRP